MGAAEKTFHLSPPPEKPPKRIKPSWWLSHVEIETRDHRDRRGKDIIDAGLRRKDEALWLRDEIRQASNDEIGFGRLARFRALPGSTPEIKKTLRRWDREIYQRSRGKARLLQGEHEPTNSFRDRVFAESDRRLDSKWHSDRARGQDERFKRVAECGKEERGILRCSHCKTEALDKNGRLIIVPKACGATLLCVSCRGRRIAKNRKRFSASRVAALHAVRHKRLGPGQVRSNPIAERFLTLTCPHIPIDAGIVLVNEDTGESRTLVGPEAQAYLVRTAYRSFQNSLRNRWRKHPGLGLVRYVRVLEATTGKDELGHVHIHVWLLSPWVRVQSIRALWGKSLVKAGFPMTHWPEHAFKEKDELLSELERAGDDDAYAWAKRVLPRKKIPWPRVHIKRIEAREKHATVEGIDLAHELIKYLCKDLDDELVLMHPGLFAAVYRGLDSGRLITASRKFWVKQHSECACCGAIDALRPAERVREGPGLARGPPPGFVLDAIACVG